MINAKINGIDVQVEPGTSILQAAHKAQVKIPTLCHHPDLPPTAACGICVVKVKNAANMMRACTTPISEGMEITTQDAEIVQIRRSVLELILSNHPNECLNCLRNGECELQSIAEDFGIFRTRLPKIITQSPSDTSTRSIVLEPKKCIRCGRCTVVCQEKQNVWALSMKYRGLHSVVSPAGDIELADSPCVRCGQCSAHCPVGAIFEYNQTDEVWKALMDPEMHCIVQIAPAVRVTIGESFGFAPGQNLTGKMYAALRRMGFKEVFDTNFGADVTIMEEASEFVDRFCNSNGPLPLITTCCPAWVDFMEKFESDMIDHFSSCKSPQAIVGALTKSYYAEKTGISPEKIFMVSIMPCTAKKYEIVRAKEMFASGQQDIDVSITTRELARMLMQAGIEFPQLPEEEADSPLGQYTGAGTIFGETGGVMEAALRTAGCLITGENGDDIEFDELHTLDGVKEKVINVAGNEVKICVAHGLKNVEDVIDRVRTAKTAGEDPPWHFIEVMACPGGCVGGGGQFWGVTDEIRKMRSKGLTQDDRGSKFRRSHENPDVQKLYQEYIGKPLSDKAHKLFHTHYVPRSQYKR
ncbi:MAG: [FeFe] hydrogenase, group A [Planctomycetota bacterium]|jgi:NADH-quinone oxidoreductase subunit G|nr:[FeFe] hydrogenase, group A [Planctomycetota bacterium]